jgi:ComF family protein
MIARTRAIGEYDGTLRELIHALKYQQRHSIARGLAALMRESGRSVLQNADCVVPVPLHRRRERTRGFNQARELARRLGPPVLEPLVRIRHTVPQVELAADQRHENLRNAFGLRKRATNLKGMRVVLVDDVSTTGATLETCAMVLRDAGVAEAHALTAARVVSRLRD